jgi:hypothetical protein
VRLTLERARHQVTIRLHAIPLRETVPKMREGTEPRAAQSQVLARAHIHLVLPRITRRIALLSIISFQDSTHTSPDADAASGVFRFCGLFGHS